MLKWDTSSFNSEMQPVFSRLTTCGKGKPVSTAHIASLPHSRKEWNRWGVHTWPTLGVICRTSRSYKTPFICQILWRSQFVARLCYRSCYLPSFFQTYLSSPLFRIKIKTIKPKISPRHRQKHETGHLASGRQEGGNIRWAVEESAR